MLISVVIPVYNGEHVLSRAVESILAQRAGDLELILVDDGSTDGSGAICDAFAGQHDQIRVIHKKNGGLSSARNAGISAAGGEYLMFLDADDYLDPDACEQVGAVIRAYHPDLIDFGWKYVSSSGEVTENQHKLRKDSLLGEETIRREILPPLLNLCHDPDHFIYDFACTKAFRTDLVRANQITFDETRRIWEDRPFVVHYLRFCRSCYSIGRCFYNYVDMPGSLSRRYSMDFFRIIIENFRQYQSLYGTEYDFDTDYVNGYWCRAIENMIFRSLEQSENQAQIHDNILTALQDPLVMQWYRRRVPQDRFERKISEKVLSGYLEGALLGYRRRLKAKRRHERLDGGWNRVKGFLSRLINRRTAP